LRSLDESKEVLYVIRTLSVLMGSGVGLEAAIHSISQGGYGIISKDSPGKRTQVCIEESRNRWLQEINQYDD
jgi:hypothetical protein